MMKHLAVATVQEIIRLAIRAQPPGSFGPKESKKITSEQIMAALTLTPEEQQLRKSINDLDDDGKAELLALVWLGRGAGGEKRKDYPKMVEYARTNLDHAAEYLSGKPLADYLTRGLSKLRDEQPN